LREVDDRSYREISQVIGISETAVGLCLMRARRSFAKAYGRLDRASQQERCEQMQASVARVFDGGDATQRTAATATSLRQVSCRPPGHAGGLALYVPRLRRARASTRRSYDTGWAQQAARRRGGPCRIAVSKLRWHWLLLAVLA
jgi:hypothetical protein